MTLFIRGQEYDIEWMELIFKKDESCFKNPVKTFDNFFIHSLRYKTDFLHWSLKREFTLILIGCSGFKYIGGKGAKRLLNVNSNN